MNRSAQQLCFNYGRVSFDIANVCVVVAMKGVCVLMPI